MLLLPYMWATMTFLPNETPFNLLWMANCILYAAVVVFLLMKKWKKKGNKQLKTSRLAGEIKRKHIYDKLAKELRKKYRSLHLS